MAPEPPPLPWFTPPAIPAAPQRWDGVVVTYDATIGFFYGELPARWLATQGIYVNALCTTQGQAGVTTFGISPGDAAQAVTIPDEAPVLVDSLLAPLVTRWRAEGRKHRIVMSCDDHWWLPRPWAPLGPGYTAFLRGVESALRLADAVVAPSARVAEHIARFGRPVTVIPPAVPPCAEWPAPRPPRRDGGLRLGFVGTDWHLGDLEALGPTMLDFLARRPDVVCVLGGMCFPAWADQHPQVERHPAWVMLPGYYRFIASLDLDGFICPCSTCPSTARSPV